MMAPDDKHPQGFWKSGLGYLTQLGIILGAVAGIVGGISALTGGESSDSAGRPKSTPTPMLQPVDLSVSGGTRGTCLKDPSHPPRLDVTVRNVGDQPAVIKRLGLRVRDTALLGIFGAGGGLEPSKEYDVLLPGKPRVGQQVLYKISQEVKPRANDRFTVRLDEPEPYRQLGTRLYQLDVLLYHDNSTAPIKAGTALVSVPYIPEKDFFWAGIPISTRGSYAGGVASMLDNNEKKFRRMLALTGERSPELNRDLVDVSVTGDEPNPCLPSGKSRTPETAQPPLSDGEGSR